MPNANLEIRGVMLDLARLTERHEFYFELLPKLADWGLNTIWWHFCDDQGFALKLDGHPEIASPGAFTKPEMRRFLKLAKQHGIDVVPEVETLGHGRYITALPQYAHLANGPTEGFNAICPSHPETLPLLGEIIAEVAEVFDSPYFHAGLDEVNFAGCPRCARRSKGKGEHWVYGKHAIAIEKIVRQAGKRMVMWADHVEKFPALVPMLPKSILLAHWQYEQVKPEPIQRSLEAGFDVVLSPALCHWRCVVQPHKQNFENMDAMTQTAVQLSKKAAAGKGGRLLGVSNTWWTPIRGMRDAYVPAVAYTGAMLSAGGPVEKVPFLQGYLRETFGLGGKTTAAALWGLYERPIPRLWNEWVLFDSVEDVAAALKLAEQSDFAGKAREVARLAKTMAAAKGKVTRNAPAYGSIVLAGDVQAFFYAQALRLANARQAYNRAGDLHGKGNRRSAITQLEKVTALGEEMFVQLNNIIARVDDDWDRTRQPRDPKKAIWQIDTTDCSRDHLLGRMVRGRAWLESMLRRFRKAVNAYENGGELPDMPA